MANSSGHWISFVLLLFVTSDFVSAFYDIANAKSLYNSLTSGYNIALRPESKVSISVEFSALSINYLDVKDQQFSITGWLTVEWTDTQLTWTPSTYNDIEDMFLTETNIWKPELVVQNSVSSVPIIDNDELHLRVLYTGRVVWDPPGVYVVKCDVDITYYPFDKQSCYVTISTWSHYNTLLDLIHSKSAINLEDFQENGEWTLTNTYVTSTTKADRNNNGNTRDKLLFNFELQRKTGYYVLNVVLPPLLTSFLGLMVFLLPAQSGEKVGYSITVLLALAVLLTIISDYIPTTSKNTSYLSIYLVVMLFISAIEVVTTILVLRLHHKADQELPVSDTVQKFTNIYLARISCFKRCCKSGDYVSEKGHAMKKTSKVSPNGSNDNLQTNREKTFIGDKDRVESITTATAVIFEKNEAHTVDTNEHQREYTWPEIALMVDTTAFLFFLFATVTSTIVFCAILVTA